MSPTRRQFLGTAGAAMAAVACVSRSSDSEEVAAGAGTDSGETAGGREAWTLFIGTYTKTGTSRGIYRATVEPGTMRFGPATLAAETGDPSFLAWAPDRRTLYAVNELLAFDGQAAGSLSAFRHTVDAQGGHALTAVGPARSTRGAAPCYVSVDAGGRHALVANYVGGNVVTFPLAADGAPGEAAEVVMHEGRGPVPKRQEAPHAHCIVPAPDDRFVLAADLGADRLFVYALDAETGRLTPAATPAAALPPGAGPRHLAFSPDGRTVYCACELDSTLAVFAYEPRTGALTAKQTLSTRPDGATGANAPADVHVHPDGRTVYLSNRGDNSIAVFRLDESTQALALVQSIPSGGDWPRNFTITPDGRGVLVAHQKSDAVVAFRIDPANGQLHSTGHVLTAPVPVCLLFA